MKYNRVILFLLACCFVACTDEWNKHYKGAGMDSAADAPTLWEQISNRSELQEFCRVLKHTGYDNLLSSGQSLTLWAPAMTKAQADSVIALYDEQKKSVIVMPDGTVRNVQDKDNKAIVQFVKNHIAMYGRSVSPDYSDVLEMMNGKIMLMTADSIQDEAYVVKNVVACNGILYTLAKPLVFQPSVREGIDYAVGTLDDVAAFFRQFDEYTLDEAASVQRGIENGKMVYADSVLRLSNRLYNYLGWIGTEDSNYVFVAPVNEVWEREYAEFRSYFNYTDKVANADSLARLNAQFGVVRGRFFNMNTQKNFGIDSLMNTRYVNSRYSWGLNVFEKPDSGLLAGLTPWTCSNGAIYLDTEGRVSPKKTFMEDRYLLATNSSSRKTPMVMVNLESKVASSVTTRSVVDKVCYGEDSTLFTFPELKEKSYLEVAPQTYKEITNRNSSIYFYLSNTFAGRYYNVYAVMVPAFANALGYEEEDVLPVRFQVFYNECLQKPRTSLTSDPNEDADYDAPSEDRALKVPSGEPHSSGTSYFLTSGDQVDVICIDKARKTTFSGYNFFGQNMATMRYRITSNVRQTDISKGVMTNILRINRLIYVSFATAEEAKAYELDLSTLKEYNVSE